MAGRPEINQHRRAVVADDDIRGLDVPMHEVMTVQRLEPAE